MGWRTWMKCGAIAGAVLSAFAAGALTGRLMLRDELANAAEPPRLAPFASDEALVAANAEAATPGLALAGGKPVDANARPDAVQLAAADDPLPGKPEAANVPDDDYAAWSDEPDEPDKTGEL